MDNAQVHRFGGRVAISLPGKGETVYLEPSEARKIAKAINACIRDVKAFPRFSESQFVTARIDMPDYVRR